MEQEIINRELKHQLEINLSEIDTELGLLFKPQIFIYDEYRHFAEESPSRIVACKQWLLSEDNAMLEKAVRYSNARVMAAEPPMCYFYDADKFEALEEMVVRVATAVRLQEFEQVDWDEQNQMDACEDADAVMKLLGCYVYFICLANRHWGPSRFDELFTRLWWAYWDNFKIEMSHFWERAELWREDWKGCLFFEI